MAAKLVVCTGAVFLCAAASNATARDTVLEAGALTCVTDRWVETDSGNGSRRADYAGRCVALPADPAAPKATEACTGTWELMADGGWKGAGTCTHTYTHGDAWSFEWQQVKEDGTITITGGSGRYVGVKGRGTFKLEGLTDTLVGGTYSQTLEIEPPRMTRSD